VFAHHRCAHLCSLHSPSPAGHLDDAADAPGGAPSLRDMGKFPRARAGAGQAPRAELAGEVF
jgi:hypothetical protein